MKDQINTIRYAIEMATPHYQADTERFKQALTALAQLEKVVGAQEPVAWAMPKGDGTFIDVITPAEHAREEGSYTVPLFAHPVAQQPQKLEDIEQYRMQMAGICTAAIGYWKEGDSIHPDYDTPALREVAKMYAKYAALYTAAQPHVPEADCGNITPAELAKRVERGEKWEVAQQPQARRPPFKEWTTDYVRENLHKLKQPQAKAVPPGYVLVPIDVLEAASESLGSFVSDHGWTDLDMQAMDNLDAILAQQKGANHG